MKEWVVSEILEPPKFYVDSLERTRIFEFTTYTIKIVQKEERGNNEGH